MGIRRLTGFMTRGVGWQATQVTGKLVIDGTALCYALYSSHHQWTLGGDYREFYDTVTEYFQQLKTLGIEPYVVLDGMDQDNSKYQTYIARNEERINNIASSYTLHGNPSKTTVRPLFTKTVFTDAVRDMKIAFFVADGEADRDIASLANSLSCPVLSNDSDYFIFNIEGGFILLTNRNQSLLDLREPVKCFRYKGFDTSFHLNSEQRLFIPFFLGNDFCVGERLPLLGITPTTRIDLVIRKVKTSGLQGVSDEELMAYGEGAVKKMRDIRSYYRVRPCSFEDLSSPKSLLMSYPHTPEWIVDNYKQDQFMTPLMSLITHPTTKRWRHTIVVEDFKQPSAWNITSIAKKFIIGALLKDHENNPRVYKTIPKAVDYGWSQKFSLVDEEIKLVSKHLTILPVPLVDIHKLSVSDRKNILFRVFHYEELADSTIPDDLQLVVVTSRCWLHNLEQQTDSIHQLVESLICCILTCYGHLKANDLKHTLTGDHQQILSFVHTFAQWQCMLHHVIAFNQVLHHPFPYISPARLFSSTILLHYYKQDPHMRKTNMDKLAMDMFQAITRDMALNQPTKRSLHEEEIEPPRKKTRWN